MPSEEMRIFSLSFSGRREFPFRINESPAHFLSTCCRLLAQNYTLPALSFPLSVIDHFGVKSAHSPRVVLMIRGSERITRRKRAEAPVAAGLEGDR